MGGGGRKGVGGGFGVNNGDEKEDRGLEVAGGKEGGGGGGGMNDG